MFLDPNRQPFPFFAKTSLPRHPNGMLRHRLHRHNALALPVGLQLPLGTVNHRLAESKTGNATKTVVENLWRQRSL